MDWDKKESARAGMRRMVKRLLKKYKYPPEGAQEALETVTSQCEMLAGNQGVTYRICRYQYYSKNEG